MKAFTTIFISSIFILSSYYSFCQNYILLEKNNGRKKIEIHEGKQLRCTCIDDQEYLGIVVKITDSTILLDNRSLIYADEIIEVNYPRKFFLGMTELGLKVGVGYLGISVINRAFSGMKLIVPRTLIITGAAIGVAGISFLASIRHVKLNEGKWKLKLITYVQEEDL